MEFKDSIQLFNFLTLLRKDAKNREIVPENMIVVPRAQFYAIEIARLREGCNK